MYKILVTTVPFADKNRLPLELLEKLNIDIIELWYLDDKKVDSMDSTLFDLVATVDNTLGGLASAV